MNLIERLKKETAKKFGPAAAFMLDSYLTGVDEADVKALLEDVQAFIANVLNPVTDL